MADPLLLALAIPAAFQPISVVVTASRLLPNDCLQTLKRAAMARSAKSRPLDLRATVRIPHGIMVRSKELPDFRAIARDLSMNGIRLEMTGAVAKGQPIPLTLDLDLVNISLKVNGEVVWVRKTGEKGKYEAGFRFVWPTPGTSESFQHYIRLVKDSLEGLT